MVLIAVDVVAIEIGTAFAALIATAAIGFSFHARLRRRAVQRQRAALRAQRAQSPAADVTGNRRTLLGLQTTTTQDLWSKTGKTGATDPTDDDVSARRLARPRSATR